MPTGVYVRRNTRPHSEERKWRISAAMLGKRQTPEHVENSRRARRGQVLSDTHKERIGNSMRGKPFSDARKSRMIHGERHPNWCGGVTSSNELARKSCQYLRWRKDVFTRDNYTCQMCGKRGGRLVADHIKSFANFPELRFVVSNGRTLCSSPCHKLTPNYGSLARMCRSV